MFKFSAIQFAVSRKSAATVAVEEGVSHYQSYFTRDDSSGSRSDGGKQQLQGNEINTVN